MKTTDQLGSTFDLQGIPQRIISLVPSQTEFLFDIGLNNRIVGITRFCVHPADKVKDREKIGGTKQFDIEKIKALEPDLIIGNKEENYEEGIAQLQHHFPVWISDIYTLQDAISMMTELGRITDRVIETNHILNLVKFPAINSGKTAAYFIWRKPYMVAARHTFINEMLNLFGVQNVFEVRERYPEVQLAELSELKPDFVFLSTEPYAFGEKHFDEFKEVCPAAKVVLVDGEMFSWYGSRLRLAASYFAQLRQHLGITLRK